MIDIRSGEKIWAKEYATVESYPIADALDYPHSHFSDDGKKLILGNYQKLYNINVENGAEQTAFISYPVNGFDGLYSSKDNNKMIGLMGSDTNRVFFWNLVTGQMENVAAFAPGDHFRTMHDIKPFPDGTKLVGISGRKLVEMDTAGKILNTYPAYPAQATPDVIDLSYNGKYVLRRFFSSGCSGSLEVFDCTTRKKVFFKTCGARSAVFANTQNIIAILEGAASELVRFYELPSGKLLQQVKVQPGARNLLYSPDDLYVALFTEGESSMSPNDDKATLIDVKKKTVSSYSHLKLLTINPASTGWDSAEMGATSIFDDAGELLYLDLQQKAFTQNIPIKKLLGTDYSNISFSNDGRLAFLGGKHATITIYDLEAKKVLARLYPDIRRKDWAVVTPDGRFDGNSGALENMYHAKGNAIVPLSAMYEKFYTPRLLPRILAGETFDPINVDVNDLKENSGGENGDSKKATGTLKWMMISKQLLPNRPMQRLPLLPSCPQDAVSEIRLYQNGKLIENHQNLEVDDDNTSKTLTRNFQVNLLGGDNHFRAIALNSQRSESKPWNCWCSMHWISQHPAPIQLPRNCISL